jgi:5-methylcytosine-specific restriction endonuclease McrA
MRRDQKAYLKAYRARPEYREQSKPYTERAKQKLKSNPVALERLVKYRQEYYLKNREVILKRTRQRQVDKAEQEKLRSKKYYLAHKKDYSDRAKRYRDAWVAIHPLLPRITPEEARERKLARGRKWRLENPDKQKTMRDSWESRNKDKRRAYNTQHTHNRRVRQKLSRKDNAAVYKWIRSWKKRRSVLCYWCMNLFLPSQCHVDHIVPISSGGKNTIDNVCISCAPCNIKKRAKSLKEWNQHLSQPVLL